MIHFLLSIGIASYCILAIFNVSSCVGIKGGGGFEHGGLYLPGCSNNYLLHLEHFLSVLEDILVRDRNLIFIGVEGKMIWPKKIAFDIL